MSVPVTRLSEALSGRYRVERQLGEGGMATVYLADDLKHGRKVALKVLRPELAAVMGADRFLAEIRTTATLQHPHILPLFDSGQADGLLWYAMPYVEGETLRERIDREKQLPVDEAVAIATKVAGALQAAHDRGVVHRDIKPANILLTEGEPLVADFGIALAVGQAGDGRLTETGLSLGTPYYMSPEQATGDRDPDGRSDIYALAAAMYEALTGEPPFTGPTAQAVLSKILTGVVRPPRELRGSVPVHVEAALLTALERTPADRFASPAAFASALNDPAYRRPRHGEGLRASSARGRAGRGFRTLLAGVLGIAAGLVAAVVFMGSGADTGPRDFGLPTEGRMAGGQTAMRIFTVAPDGTFVVYASPIDGDNRYEVWRLDLETGAARALPGTRHTGLWTYHVSPDGTRIALQDFEPNELRIVPAEGGTPRVILDSNHKWGGEWMDDGTLMFADNEGRLLRWVDGDRGLLRDLAVDYCQLPIPLDGDRILCGGGSDKYARVLEVDGDPSSLRPVLQRTETGLQTLRGAGFHRVEGEYLVYTSVDATIMAARFIDQDSLVVGPSVPLVSGVRRALYSGDGFFDLTRDGTLVYAPGVNADRVQMAVSTPSGATEVLLDQPEAHLRFNISGDGRSLATVVDGVREQELRLYDVATGDFRLLATGSRISTPFWEPDGQALAYSVENPEGTRVVRHALTSAEGPRVLADLPDGADLVHYADPGLMLVQTRGRPVLVLDADRSPPVVDSIGTAGTFFASISRDRSLLVWRDGSDNLYLQPWPERDRRWNLANGPYEPYWLPDGDLLVSAPGMGLGRIELDPAEDPPHGSVEPAFNHPRLGDGPGWSRSITADGRVVHPWLQEQPFVSYLRVVPGWVETMREAVDAETEAVLGG